MLIARVLYLTSFGHNWAARQCGWTCSRTMLCWRKGHQKLEPATSRVMENPWAPAAGAVVRSRTAVRKTDALVREGVDAARHSLGRARRNTGRREPRASGGSKWRKMWSSTRVLQCFSGGEAHRTLFIVAQGQIELTLDATHIQRSGPLSTLGAAAALSGELGIYSARALTASVLLLPRRRLLRPGGRAP
jgi:hypothetical protein